MTGPITLPGPFAMTGFSITGQSQRDLAQAIHSVASGRTTTYRTWAHLPNDSKMLAAWLYIETQAAALREAATPREQATATSRASDTATTTNGKGNAAKPKTRPKTKPKHRPTPTPGAEGSRQ
jgi:hypothetical protein